MDPNGERTFGVCTKIDESLARKDTCAKILASRDTDILLKLGWIAVRNRSQDEVDNSLSFEDARAREQALFTTHPTLSELPSTHWGIPELITRLARLQNERIRILLPAISAQVRQRLTEKKKLLASLAERVSSPHEAYLK